MNEAKENVLTNFRANYPGNHQMEIFLMNTMENIELLVKSQVTKKAVRIIEQYKKHSSHNAGDTCLNSIISEIKEIKL